MNSNLKVDLEAHHNRVHRFVKLLVRKLRINKDCKIEIERGTASLNPPAVIEKVPRVKLSGFIMLTGDVLEVLRRDGHIRADINLTVFESIHKADKPAPSPEAAQ